jgi:hypothetical protein
MPFVLMGKAWGGEAHVWMNRSRLTWKSDNTAAWSSWHRSGILTSLNDGKTCERGCCSDISEAMLDHRLDVEKKTGLRGTAVRYELD